LLAARALPRWRSRAIGPRLLPVTPASAATNRCRTEASSSRGPASKPVDLAAVAFRWLALPQRFELRHRFTLFRQLQPQLPAPLGLPIQSLRHRGRAAHLT